MHYIQHLAIATIFCAAAQHAGAQKVTQGPLEKEKDYRLQSKPDEQLSITEPTAHFLAVGHTDAIWGLSSMVNPEKPGWPPSNALCLSMLPQMPKPVARGRSLPPMCPTITTATRSPFDSISKAEHEWWWLS